MTTPISETVRPDVHDVAAAFLGTAFRNIDLPMLSHADMRDIGDELLRRDRAAIAAHSDTIEQLREALEPDGEAISAYSWALGKAGWYPHPEMIRALLIAISARAALSRMESSDAE